MISRRCFLFCTLWKSSSEIIAFMLTLVFFSFIFHPSAIEMVIEHVFHGMGSKGMAFPGAKTLRIKPGGDFTVRLAFIPSLESFFDRLCFLFDFYAEVILRPLRKVIT